jgi:hypothetical protein
MALNSTVLFGTPQSEIASLLNNRMSNASRVNIITGFATVEGVKALEETIRLNPTSLELFVLGAGTYKAYEALDQLIEFGVSNSSLFVHLGHTRLTKESATHSFYRYHPMLHSKIYYFENSNNTACAFIGSHNVTGFALMGLNGEAAVMLEGETDHPEFEKVRRHIEHAKNEAIAYQRGMKEAYSWWTNQFFQGLVQKASDIPRDIDKTKTILVFCEYHAGVPQANEMLYFELREALGRLQSLRAEVHVFVFDVLPRNPSECIANLKLAKQSFWCSVEGIENNEGGKELAADWFIQQGARPQLNRTANPFRPTPLPGMQQIRVRLKNAVFHKYDYLFGKQNINWFPILDEQRLLNYDNSFALTIQKLNLIPPETKEWYLVSGLTDDVTKHNKEKTPYELALQAMEPESGEFILFSTGRREIKK